MWVERSEFHPVICQTLSSSDGSRELSHSIVATSVKGQHGIPRKRDLEIECGLASRTLPEGIVRADLTSSPQTLLRDITPRPVQLKTY